MLKVILNNDTEHTLTANDVNRSVTMKIDNYSEHSENINLNIFIESVDNLSYFENVKIESLQILDEQDTLISALIFNEDLYITSYNFSIYGVGTTVYVNINKIKKNQVEE